METKDIKFRGETENDKWLFGSLIVGDNFSSILTEEALSNKPFDEIGLSVIQGMVDLNTVGQYIGRKDKNKKEIYDGDIMQHPQYENPFVVVWNQEKCLYQLNRINGYGHFFFGDFEVSEWEIIGNIHDNYDLLERSTK